jgi:hypothetical protein
MRRIMSTPRAQTLTRFMTPMFGMVLVALTALGVTAFVTRSQEVPATTSRTSTVSEPDLIVAKQFASWAKAFPGVTVTTGGYVRTTLADYERAFSQESSVMTSSGVGATDPLLIVKLAGTFPASMHPVKQGVSVPPAQAVITVYDMATSQTLERAWEPSVPADLIKPLGSVSAAADGNAHDLRMLGTPTIFVP